MKRGKCDEEEEEEVEEDEGAEMRRKVDGDGEVLVWAVERLHRIEVSLDVKTLLRVSELW